MKAARLLMACSLLALAGAAGAEDLKTAIDKDYPSLDRLYKTLHAHPELSTQEVETAKRLAEEATGLPCASKVKVKNVKGELVAPLEAALGKDNVIKTDPIMASEDFSRYGLVDPKIPSAILWVGGVEAKKWAATADKNTIPSLHSAYWAPDPEPTIKTGIVTLVTAAQDLLKK